MKKILFVTFLLSLSTAIYADPICDAVSGPDVRSSLVLHGFKCLSRSTGSCSYTECMGKMPGYTKDVMVLLPNIVTSLRVHFHGHFSPKLPAMVKEMKLAPSICAGDEAVVIPESTGKCADYDKELVDRKSVDAFLAGIHGSTGNHLKTFPLHLSAHSGGGRTVSRMLKAGIDPEGVTIFDGIYSDEQRVELSSWFKRSEGSLNIFNAAGGSPSKQSLILLTEIDQNPRPVFGPKYTVKKGSRLNMLERKDGTGKAHSLIVPETWNMSNF